MLRSYIPHGSTDELLSSLGHIDPTATLKKLTPHERAIEECKRINWWRECEKQKPAGVEDLSSDEEGDDEADEDPAQVCVYAQMDTKRPKTPYRPFHFASTPIQQCQHAEEHPS